MPTCICGRQCATKSGLTLHQKSCPKAKAPPVVSSETGAAVIRVDLSPAPAPTPSGVAYEPMVKKLHDLATTACGESDACLKTGNKSAGRRGRIAMNELRKYAAQMRKDILVTMKNGKK